MAKILKNDFVYLTISLSKSAKTCVKYKCVNIYFNINFNSIFIFIPYKFMKFRKKQFCVMLEAHLRLYIVV